MNVQRVFGRSLLLAMLMFSMSVGSLFAAPVQNGRPQKGIQKSPANPQEEKESEAADLPSANEILDRHIEAVGGERAIKSHKFQTSTGTFEFIGPGLKGTIKIQQAAPNLMLMTMESPQLGTIRQGYNGEIAWAIEPNMGPQLLEGDLLADVKKDADFYADLNYAERFPKRETLNKEEFNGIECYRLRLTTATDRTYEAFYSVDTGLYAGQKGNTPTMQGEMAMIAKAEDYKTVDGVKIPHTIITEVPDFHVTQKTIFETITHEEFDKSVFDLPNEIKTLVEIEEEEGDDDNDGNDDEPGANDEEDSA